MNQNNKNDMIQIEAKQIKEKLNSDLLNIGINDKKVRNKIAKLMATKLKEATKDSVYQYVINQLNEELG